MYALGLKNGIQRYIGFTTGSALIRFDKHVCNAFVEKRISKLYSWVRKHGPDNIVVTVIEELDSLADLQRREMYWIAFFHTHQDFGGLNMTAGGVGGWDKGVKRSASWHAARNAYHSDPANRAEHGRKVAAGYTPERREEYAQRIQTHSREMAAKGQHVRWHVNRRRPSDTCDYCTQDLQLQRVEESRRAGGRPTGA